MMNNDEAIYLATNNGVVTTRKDDGRWRAVGHSLEGHDVTAIIAREGVILAGTTDGMFDGINGFGCILSTVDVT